MITRDWMMSPNVTEWKLVDVPELGYFTTDKPFPRGELLLKTKSMISGYYKHQDVRLLASILARLLPKLPGKVKQGRGLANQTEERSNRLFRSKSFNERGT